MSTIKPGPNTFVIRGGGNKGELFAQLSDIGRIPMEQRPWFEFRLEAPSTGKHQHRTHTLVDSISCMGRSPDQWRIEGEILTYTLASVLLRRLERPQVAVTWFHAEYNTQTRDGLFVLGKRR
jgi:hypothetical protein